MHRISAMGPREWALLLLLSLLWGGAFVFVKFALGALLTLGIVSTALAYLVFFRILAAGGATGASLVTLLIPVGAILLGHLVLGERLAVNHLAGMELIALGLLSIDGRMVQRLRREDRP